MPARFRARLGRAAVTAAMPVALALAGTLLAVGPVNASIRPAGIAQSVPLATASPVRTVSAVRFLTLGVGGGLRASLVASPRPVPAPVVTSASRVLALAAALRGRPYVYGASGPSAFDCSGFTRYVFAHSVARSLVHNAAAQYAASVKIAKSSIRPGDLVFYTYGGWVYHVGIYAGRGLIWDAPHTGQTVHLEAIATSSWVAGRVL